MRLKNLITLTTASLLAFQASANPFRASVILAAKGGGIQGGGGDAFTETRILEIRDDLANWIKDGGAKGLKFASGLTYEDYLKGNQEKNVYGMQDALIPE